MNVLLEIYARKNDDKNGLKCLFMVIEMSIVHYEYICVVIFVVYGFIYIKDNYIKFYASV